MKIPCSLVLDLLSAYIEGLCSQETAALVDEHLAACESCRGACEALKAPVEVKSIEKKNNLKSANPMKKIRKDQFYRVGFAVLLTLVLAVSAMFAVQEVGFLHDFFFPKQVVSLRTQANTAEWQVPYYSFSGKDYLIFDSIFYDMEVVNDANSAGPVTIRIKDADGNIVLDNLTIEPGELVSLDLERFTPYWVEILAADGSYFLNFV